MRASLKLVVVSAAVAALVSGGTVTAVAAPPPADPFPVEEPFAGSFTSDQWVLPDDANNATELLPTGLRLTNAVTGGTGNATLAQPFRSDVAFHAEFDYQAFGGGNPGDAFTFFLMDGAQAPNLGIGGGAAGYAGMQGGYVAVGFDNAGNFSADNFAPFNVGAPNHVVLRGGAATPNAPQWPVLAIEPATIQTDGVTPRHVAVTVAPSGADSILLTVVVDGATLFDAVDVRTIAPAADAGAGIPARLQPARPATFALGFSAGTGGATDNYDITNLVATAAADLAITKTGPASVEPGTTGTWTIVVANDDTNPVEGATVTDSGLPAGMTDAAWTCTATAGVCPADAGIGSGPWAVDLERGGTATFVVTGTVPDASAGSTIVNTANVAAPADRTETDLADNTSVSTTIVPAFPDLAVSTALSTPAPLMYGQSATWSVDVENIGAGDAPGSTVAIALPAILDPASVTAPPGCTLTGSTLTCVLGDLIAGAATQLTVTGDATADLAVCTDETATLTADAATTRRELVVANNSATVSTPCVVPVDLAIAKAANTGVTVGGTVVWTVTVSNAGPVAAPQTAISDALPASAEWTCTVSDGSACDAAAGTGPVDVTATIPSDGSATVVARVPASAAGTVTNTASLTACDACVDASTDDDTATATAVISAVPDGGGSDGGGSDGGGSDAGLPATGGTASVVPVVLAGLLLALGAGLIALRRRAARG
ncbi:LPXTG cell wall anchor domain-containing protein [Microbacterium sp. NPDC058389]|uniref:LPXTG cell wall anchor domain-containing protein n=1 Tax=Microbacterium sp. NPDC058389 TaxID=3346475 RepID=UPI0036546619